MFFELFPASVVEQAPVLVVAIPLLSALVISIVGLVNQKYVLPLTILSMAGSLIASLITLQRVIEHGPISYHLGSWIPPIGIEYFVDHLNAPVLVLIAAVSFLTAIYSKDVIRSEVPDKIPSYYVIYTLLVTGLLGITITGDAFNLYVLLEVAALTAYGLIALRGGRAYMATFNYIIMGTIGAGFYLLGVGYLFIKTGSLNMLDIGQILPAIYSGNAVLVAFILVMLGMWIKMAFFPLHGWLPNAYTYAPTATSCLVAPLMTKVSVYVMIRIMFTIFSADFAFNVLKWHNIIVWWAVIAIVSGSLFALAQRNLKKMLSYIIVSEIGYMVGGIWLANRDGITGATYHIFSDAMMTLCLFMAVGCICYKAKDCSFENMRWVFRRMPVTMAAFIVGAFSMIGIPPTCGFFSKWFLFSGAIKADHWGFALALIFSSLINAVLFFRLFEIGYFVKLKDSQEGQEQSHHHQPKISVKEAPLSMVVPLVVVAMSLIFLGLYTNEIVTNLIDFVIPKGLMGVGS